jgi:putative restriction endonuclease
MAFGVFLHRSDSIYDDSPAERYQFPRQYLGRVQACINDWIIYLEPSKVKGSRGYFAVAKVREVIADPGAEGMYIAIITPRSYLDFANPVPFNGSLGIVERGVLNDVGRISGRAQSAVRAISARDFNRIIEIGLADDEVVLPRTDDDLPSSGYAVMEPQTAFLHEQPRDRVIMLTSRAVRDRVFRQTILRAYDSRCALTGLKLINGGGRAEAEAAHIRPVEHDGPDITGNGLALSGTAHWMFDRGLISLADDLEILISRHVNDIDSVRGMINADGRARLPLPPSMRPHPQFLDWHRRNRFKA